LIRASPNAGAARALFTFVAEIEAEFGCAVGAGDFDGDFSAGAIFVKEGVDGFEQQGLPPGGDYLRELCVGADLAREVELTFSTKYATQCSAVRP
jgi:hypothetical protein